MSRFKNRKSVGSQNTNNNRSKVKTVSKILLNMDDVSKPYLEVFCNDSEYGKRIYNVFRDSHWYDKAIEASKRVPCFPPVMSQGVSRAGYWMNVIIDSLWESEKLTKATEDALYSLEDKFSKTGWLTETYGQEGQYTKNSLTKEALKLLKDFFKIFNKETKAKRTSPLYISFYKSEAGYLEMAIPQSKWDAQQEEYMDTTPWINPFHAWIGLDLEAITEANEDEVMSVKAYNESQMGKEDNTDSGNQDPTGNHANEGSEDTKEGDEGDDGDDLPF